MELQFELLADQQLAYMRRIGAYGEENYELMDKFKNWAGKNQLLNEDAIIYGIARDNPQTTAPENCRYDVGIVVGADFKVKELEIERIEGGRYLSFKIEHTAAAVQEFWNGVFRILQEKNQIFDENRLILERYAVKLVEKGYCEFCVPIK